MKTGETGMTSGKRNGAKNGKSGANALRRRAEEKTAQLPAVEDLSPEEAQRLVHELRVHQFELEMQNDTLREAQAELVESNERYTDLYDFAPVGYLTLNEKGVILEANLTLARQLEVERGGLLGLPFSNFIVPSEKAVFRSHLSQTFETQEPQSFETRLATRKKESEIHALIESILVESPRGGKQCRMSVADISERKRAEEALKVYMKRLERSNQELQEFAFIASHDLQEPLRKIKAFGSRIEEKHAGVLGDEGRDYLKRMVSAANRMSDMVQGLLAYSRVSTRTKPFETVDLTRLVRELESDLDILIEKTGARIEIGRLPILEADSSQIYRLFQNIIGNALKFHGQEKPVIKIYSKPGLEPSSNKRTHRIFIEDNGIGFNEEHLERIFTLFQRLHGRSAYEGTGMGLAICRKIVERHHGAITATSTPGNGATFIITLPETQPAEE